MKRWIPLTAAALVIAAIALYLAWPRGPAAPVAAVAEPAPSASAPSTPSAPPSLPSSPATPTAPAEPGSAGAPPREYVLADGTRVRDRRTGATEPFAIPSTPPPVPVTRLHNDEVVKVHAQLEPLARQCAAAIPASERAADATLQIRMLVTVTGGVFTIDEVTTRSRGLGERAASVEACAKERAQTVSIAVASDHPAVARYPLTFPYRVAGE